ncbi:major facilitator superfamily transporter [Weissella oryzae SG25]|uniref:Major facilitator superfamily transporter n=1 Tax=Weissella oryzae (strain DSM 25784 / JCM 18191 / LMG 30913 / SG25) TaxID=1329250 RepID=A0A069D3E7_WEIOS|nr:hypothetical protein [Weissella oryzae]GAK31911.1 major facilitator superfamily transporter [Weissella oryzae SG25]
MSKFMNDIFECCLIPVALIFFLYRLIKGFIQITIEAPIVGIGMLIYASLLFGPTIL